nr:DNA adenine methylase [Spiroplasma sp. SV19]
MYILLIYGFNRILRFNKDGHFNVPVGNVDFNKNVVNSLNNYFSFVKNKKINFSNLNWYNFLESITFKKDDFIYLDPPYLISFSEYNKLWSEKDEIKLLNKLDELDKIGVKFAISNLINHKGTTNKIFRNWSEKYKIIEINSNYISYHDNSKKIILERY